MNMKFENVNELNIYINSNYKKINITGVDTENLEIFIDGEITKNKQYAFIKFSDEKAYMQYKNQNDIAGIDFLRVVSHQINLEEFYTLMDSKKVAYIEFIKIEEEIETGEEEYVLATDDDFSGTGNGNFRYIGTDEYVAIPHIIKGVPVTSYNSMFRDTSVKGVTSTNKNVRDMGYMFSGTQATSLNLSSFDTSSATDMYRMFHNSKATSLDLRSFDTSNVTDMSYMFYRSPATIGYARTQSDADNFNSSSNKSAGLTFIVKDISEEEEEEEEEIETGEITYTDTTVGWAFDRANIEFAWERGYTGKGIKALIVDNGFHELPGELEFVEVYGEDDLTKSHGTQVGSCLGAKMNDSGLVGVAPDIELYGFAKKAGGSTLSLLPEITNYVIDNGIRIINYSLVIPSSTPSQTLIDAFEYLESLGVLVFASLGNFGQDFGRSIFSMIPTIIGVGGILLDSNNNLEISTGTLGATNNVDCDYLFSYGTNVLTPDGTVTQASGTSFGTPAIAGMFALLMQEFPNATKKELMDIMNYNGEKVDNYYGIFPKYGSHTEMLVEIYPPNSNLNVYPVTLSSGVIEKGNKLFVNKEEREYLEKVISDNVKMMPISGGVLENYREKLTTVSESGGSIDLSLGNVFQHTPSGGITYSITNAVSGQAHSFTLIINMGSTVRTLIFPASVKWQGGEIPDTTIPNKTYVLTFMTVDGGTTWLAMFGGEF